MSVKHVGVMAAQNRHRGNGPPWHWEVALLVSANSQLMMTSTEAILG